MTDLEVELCNRANEIGKLIWDRIKDPKMRLIHCVTLATILALHPIAVKEENPVNYMKMVDGILAAMRENAILIWTHVREKKP